MGYSRRFVLVSVFLAFAASGAFAASATQVVSGSTHACALTTDGGVLCWGNNYYGQLGDGWWLDRLTPGPVLGLETGVTAIAAVGYHTCALRTGGAVVCWGRNHVGQLGDGTTTDRFTPTQVSGLTGGVAALTAAYSGACALTTGGGILCWGYNGYGQVGDGTTTDRWTPTQVSGMESGVATVTMGGNHTCALMTDDHVECWGYNSHGQLGDGTFTHRLTPTSVIGLPIGVSVAAIAAGEYHTCASLTGVGIACWGYNGYGQLGDGTTDSRTTPRPVVGLGSEVAAIAAGDDHTCALTAAGGMLCWGNNGNGQLGDGTTSRRHTPTPVTRLGNRVASMALFVGDTCAVTTTGGAACWGWNNNGRLGDQTTTDRWVPTRLTGLEGRVITAYDFTGDVKSDALWRHSTLGEVWLWAMDGSARTAETFVRRVADTDWEIRSLGDQTGEGQADILWRNKTSGEIYFWPMDGSTPLAETYVTTVDPSYDILGAGDYNGNGKSDLLWRHKTNGAVWIWLMDGATLLSEVYMSPVKLSYVVKGAGDVDGDGKEDVLWHHATTGEVWAWLMDGTSRLDQVWLGTVPDTGYQIQGVADFNDDSAADVLWWHSATGEVWIWTMGGGARLAETLVATVPDTGYRIVGTGDYNGDGKADILWQHATRGEVWVWLMNGTMRISETWVATVADVGYKLVR